MPRRANPARRRSDARAGYRSHQRRALRSAVGNGEARCLRGLPRGTADSILQNGNAVVSGSARGFSLPPRKDAQRHDPGKREAKPKTKMLERQVLGTRAVQWVSLVEARLTLTAARYRPWQRRPLGGWKERRGGWPELGL